MLYVIKQGEDIYTVALNLYGDSSYAVKLLIDNDDIEYLDNQDIAGLEVDYDETIKKTIKYNLVVSNSVISDKQESYAIKQGQSIYDLSIMYGYGVGSVVQFIQDSEVIQSLNSVELSQKIIHVTKKQTDVTDALILQNKTLATNIGSTVFGTEDLTTIFVSEDGSTQFTFEA